MISEALQEIIQELAEIEDRMERFEFIFDLAEVQTLFTFDLGTGFFWLFQCHQVEADALTAP